MSLVGALRVQDEDEGGGMNGIRRAIGPAALRLGIKRLRIADSRGRPCSFRTSRSISGSREMMMMMMMMMMGLEK